MSGIKQFGFEILNFLVNLVIIVIVMIIANFLYLDFCEYSKEGLKSFNIILSALFISYLLFQNIFFPSFFYMITKNRINSSMLNPKIGILCHNLFFNTIVVGSIVVEVCKLNYGIRFVSLLLLLLDFIPSFMERYSKSLTCYLFKISTIKIEKRT
ncbi:MAG: hypothetical protein HUK25_05215 [Treponema sp.]|nr:hypothetical protein [Treponema sp.]